MRLVGFGRSILDVTLNIHSLVSYVSIGGVETNVAINNAILGGDSILFGSVGLDILFEKLKNLTRRVPKLHLCLQRVKDKRSGVIVLLINDKDEVHQKFIDYGVSECFQITSEVQKQITAGEIFFTSLWSANTPVLQDKWKEMIQLAKDASLEIAVNMGGVETIERTELLYLLKLIKDSANFIFMTEQEWKRIKPVTLPSSIVVITNGPKATIVRFKEKEWRKYPPRILSVPRPYSIGAGDAFTAGFLRSYLKNKDIEKAMRYGHQIAALKLSLPTSHLTPEILEKEVKS